MDFVYGNCNECSVTSFCANCEAPKMGTECGVCGCIMSDECDVCADSSSETANDSLRGRLLQDVANYNTN